MAAFLAITATACAAVAVPSATVVPASAEAPSAAPSTGLLIPTGDVPAWVQCALDGGLRLVSVVPPQIAGDPPEYRFEWDHGGEGLAIFTECTDKYPTPDKPKTDAEVRVIFDRWVKERECLVGLGYHPVEPPTFEKFLADWNSTGPWMPIDGIDTNAWSGADYEAAKKACMLEFFSRN